MQALGSFRRKVVRELVDLFRPTGFFIISANPSKPLPQLARMFTPLESIKQGEKEKPAIPNSFPASLTS